MKPNCMFASAASLILSAAAVVAQDEKTELEGTWIVESALEQGAETAKPIGDKVSFTMNKISIESHDGKKPPAMIFELDETKTPKQITIHFKQDDTPLSVKGVYAVDAELLSLCLARPGADRPTKLESQPDTMQFSLKLKRKADDAE